MDNLWQIIIPVIGLFLLWLTWFVSQYFSKKDMGNYQTQISDYQKELTQLQTINASLETELRLLKQQQGQYDNQLQAHFKNLANELLAKNQTELKKTNADLMQQVLSPVQKDLKDFKDSVKQAQETDIANTATLKQEFEQLRQANQQITSDAQALTNALKGDKQKQGAWGEVILERVLEISGLTQGREFELQKSFQSEDKQKQRPDAIIYLPNNRQIIIDAKVSLNAYKEAVGASDEAVKISYLNQHVTAISNHISTLSDKKYYDLAALNSLDFILLFMPIEGALLAALETKPSLYDDAFQKNIILVSPSTLQLALRTVEATWRFQRQKENIEKVAKRANLLYEKFAGFVSDMDKVGAGLQVAEKHHIAAMDKLHRAPGNLMGQAEKLKELAAISSRKKLSKKDD